MKKYLKMVLITGMVSLLSLTGCATVGVHTVEGAEHSTYNYTAEIRQNREYPSLYITSLDIGSQGIHAIQLTTNWTYFDEYGNAVSGVLSDSLHPLQLRPQDFSAATLHLPHDPQNPIYIHSLGLDFAHQPQSVSVVRWRAEYIGIGDMSDVLDEDVDVLIITETHTITFVDDGNDYVYMVQGVWQSGTSILTFRVNSGLTISGGVAVEEQTNETITVQSPPLQPQLHSLDIASEWATESIAMAHLLGLIPNSLFASPTFTNYTLPTTRAEFTALAVLLYETIKEQEITGRVTFTDTNDVNVQKAAYIGIVSGVGNNNFAPDMSFNREQAAVIISRLAEVLNKPFPQADVTFADTAQISSWARERVEQVQAAGIMSGVGNNMFNPQGNFTREQSIVTILRLYELLSE